MSYEGSRRQEREGQLTTVVGKEGDRASRRDLVPQGGKRGIRDDRKLVVVLLGFSRYPAGDEYVLFPKGVAC